MAADRDGAEVLLVSVIRLLSGRKAQVDRRLKAIVGALEDYRTGSLKLDEAIEALAVAFLGAK